MTTLLTTIGGHMNGSWKNWLLGALAAGVGALIASTFGQLQELSKDMAILKTKVDVLERIVLPTKMGGT